MVTTRLNLSLLSTIECSIDFLFNSLHKVVFAYFRAIVDNFNACNFPMNNEKSQLEINRSVLLGLFNLVILSDTKLGL